MIIEPVERISGTLKAPSSKSYTHRVLFLGLLSDGVTRFEDPLRCEDTNFTLETVRDFGATCDWNSIESDGSVAEANIHAGESGTTARIATAVAGLSQGVCKIDGAPGLRKRPMQPLLEALSQLGIKTESRGGRLPVVIHGKGDEIEENKVKMSDLISSQFITAMMYLGSKAGLEIEIEGGLVSEPYVDMTVEVLEKGGTKIDREGNSYLVEGGVEPNHFSIPGDYSSAAFYLAAGALFGDITIENLHRNSLQADKKILDILEEIGADIKVREDKVKVRMDELNGFEINCDDFPDLFPILTVLGIYSEGESVLTGKQLRYKESDRIKSMVENLEKMGADIEELGEGVLVKRSELKGAEIDPKGDHRIAMALSIAALGAEGKTFIKDHRCVKKSYPKFFKHLEQVIEDGR